MWTSDGDGSAVGAGEAEGEAEGVVEEVEANDTEVKRRKDPQKRATSSKSRRKT